MRSLHLSHVGFRFVSTPEELDNRLDYGFANSLEFGIHDLSPVKDDDVVHASDYIKWFGVVNREILEGSF